MSLCTCAPSLGSQVQPHQRGSVLPTAVYGEQRWEKCTSWFREPFLLGWVLKLPWAKGSQESVLTVGTVTEKHGSECTVQQEALPGNTKACVWRRLTSHAQVARGHTDQQAEDCGSSGRKWQGHFLFEWFHESFHSCQWRVFEIHLCIGPVVVLCFTLRSRLRGWELGSSAMSWPQKLCPGSTTNVLQLSVGFQSVAQDQR